MSENENKKDKLGSESERRIDESSNSEVNPHTSVTRANENEQTENSSSSNISKNDQIDSGVCLISSSDISPVGAVEVLPQAIEVNDPLYKLIPETLKVECPSVTKVRKNLEIPFTIFESDDSEDSKMKASKDTKEVESNCPLVKRDTEQDSFMVPSCSSCTIPSAYNVNLPATSDQDLKSEKEITLPAESFEFILNDPSNPSHNFNPDNSTILVPTDNQKLKKANRCAVCKKKVGLTGIVCRCGDVFCSIHRYTDMHECPINYRELGAEEIRKKNPVVKKDKVNKI
ncbi:zinc finger A20 and AN1 domain-containing stress-associated protein 6-like [Cimex lectularius]|uniref:AN1-type domain-containing protein n=1 Tax=Cimex lectularius TaxID=79782 RepID=A0A8I6R8Z9_CIMLE|nr:zinc finger A20 and AN1 domain-containing stress-associated protein 6-like [Cimex lectularius]